MARVFTALSTDQIQCSIGTPQNIGFGTWAAILRRTTNGAAHNVCRLASATPTNRFGLFVQTNDLLHMACDANLSAGPGLAIADGWCFIAGGKATGSATPRFHKFRYGVDTIVAHSNGSAAIVDATAPGTSGTTFLGSRSGGPCWAGDIALIALFDRNLTDLETEAMPFSLTYWLANRPVGLWLLDESLTTQNVSDRMGNGGNQSGLTGTAVSSQSVPIFSYGARVLTEHAAAAAAAALASRRMLVGVGL